jgi:Zn finger protein HypA/HybF involved in hydrogenase expression
VAAGASTEVQIAPLRAACATCPADFETVDPIPVCPDCRGTDVAMEGGDELVLQWVEYSADAGKGAPRESVGADGVPVAVREDHH